MGTGEESTPPKPSKPASSTQEIPTTHSYPDWSSSMQAYYGPGATPPFFASTVASPTPHPYLWGSQHPLIPPYGTPVPYPAIYPPGGVYAHPNMTMTPNPVTNNAELEGKGPDGKDRASAKKSKGTSVSLGKAGESAKAASGSGNDGASQSDESGTEGTSDASDENNDQQDFAGSKKGSFHKMLADGGSGAAKVRQNPSGASSTLVIGEGVMPEQWVQQDERELKRQKRKQSNRESARRSRLRKQAECEELQGRVENLNNENRTLKDELQRLSEECGKLTSENSSIKMQLLSSNRTSPRQFFSHIVVMATVNNIEILQRQITLQSEQKLIQL
ncbi:G-box-binding factor 1 isoform X3 [Corylus avellana]|uniref:G-box-binding factor 1 isoform X3 n=1 Tax=Corylus avellana TaxID=13451 RepID=UPI00286CD889|nr:G-box-binding factor 1 isoform X3 [Corylus avellana]